MKNSPKMSFCSSLAASFILQAGCKVLAGPGTKQAFLTGFRSDHLFIHSANTELRLSVIMIKSRGICLFHVDVLRFQFLLNE
jgi:hypothetical protein